MRIKVFCIFLVQCLVLSAFAVEVQVETEMKVKKDSATDFVTIKSGDSFQLNRGESAIAMHSDGMPFFILAPRDEKSKVVLASGDIQALVQTQVSNMVNQQVNEIVTGLRKSETLMAKRDYAQATTILNALKSKYTNVASIYFMSASVAYLMNNKNMAAEDLQKGLNLDPTDQTAKGLLEKLKVNQ